MKEEGVQSRVALSTHSPLQPSICPSLSRPLYLSLSLSTAGSLIRSAHLNKMEFVKWVAATVAVRLQFQARDQKVEGLESQKTIKENMIYFVLRFFFFFFKFIDKNILDRFLSVRRGHLLPLILVDYENRFH